MSASLKVDVGGLRRIAARFEEPAVRTQLNRLPQERAIAALVGQAIADNFNQEGPGWAPLKPDTIRSSVAKKMRKSIADMTDKELLRYEKKARQPGAPEAPHRQILRRTGLLMKTATIPDYSGSNKGVNGKNIWKTEGSNLIWGTDLVYAAAHQNGNPSKNLPARPFLKLQPKWVKTLQEYVVKRASQIVTATLFRGGL